MFSVCIIPSGDRQGQVNLIHHYCRIGWNVYIPKHGTGNFDWKKTATWPALLCRSLKNTDKRNLDIHGFERAEDNIFGEDRFIQLEDNGPLYEDQSTVCELVDFEKEEISIDAFHTLRGSDDYFERAMEFSKKYFPDAKWISSTIAPYSATPPLNLYSKNVCRMMPGKYDPQLYQNANYFDLYPSGFEFDLLNVDRKTISRKGFASFNHNYQIRCPKEYKFFKKVNKRLPSFNLHITNYGSNAPGQGADIKYSQGYSQEKDSFRHCVEKFKYWLKGVHDIDYKWPTLSIRQAAQQNTQLKAVVLFKETDWGGGVVWYAMSANTPIVTHRRYVEATNAQDVILHDYNSIVVTTEDEAVEAILRLERDEKYLNKLINGMRETYSKLVAPEYWEKFRVFVQKSLQD
jgi:hypothetical protein